MIFRSHAVVAGSGDDVELLLPGQVNELDRIAGNTDRKVCVLRLLRMLHGVLQLLDPEHVDVQMMGSALKIAVHDRHQVVLLLRHAVAQGTRIDGLGIGDSVERVLVRDLGDRIQGRQKAVLLRTVGRIGSRCKWSVGGSSVRKGAGRLAVDDRVSSS